VAACRPAYHKDVLCSERVAAAKASFCCESVAGQHLHILLSRALDSAARFALTLLPFSLYPQVCGGPVPPLPAQPLEVPQNRGQQAVRVHARDAPRRSGGCLVRWFFVRPLDQGVLKCFTFVLGTMHPCTWLPLGVPNCPNPTAGHGVRDVPQNRVQVQAQVCDHAGKQPCRF